jgi:hypothetical protein
MKINLDSEEIARIVMALEHYNYTCGPSSGIDCRYMRLAERLRLHK